MPYSSFTTFMDDMESPIRSHDLIKRLSSSEYCYLFVKDTQGQYLYANDAFIKLVGLTSLTQLRNLTNHDLYQNKCDVERYRALDVLVMSEQRSIDVRETVAPKLNPSIVTTMEGSLYPLYARGEDKVHSVLGLVTPETRLLTLDWETLFGLSANEFSSLLNKRRYLIQFDTGQLILSKMEIRTLFQLLKGEHAGEIAMALHIKQSTVESYLTNIRNKFGVSQKSKLIQMFMDTKVLQQVLL